ncbi:MAG: hypothetical protein WCX65_16810 [bacterium]
MKKTAFILAIAAAVLFASAGANAKTSKEVWDGMLKTWSSCSDVQGVVSLFTYYPEPIRKYYKDLDVELKDNTDGWRYQVLEYTWKKPNWIHIRFIYARNMGKNLVSKLVESKPGTRIVFGVKDTENMYAKFPPTGDKSIDKQIDKQIFYVPFNTKEYNAAILGNLSFAGTLEDVTKSKKHYFDDGKVSMVESKERPQKVDFKFENGKPKFIEKKVKGNYYVITFTPKNPANNKGIDKDIVYINKNTQFPEQLESYYKGTLVACFQIDDVKTNLNLDDSLWDTFFKDARIMKSAAAK